MLSATAPRFQMYVNGIAWAGADEGLPLSHFEQHYVTLLVAFCMAYPQAGVVQSVELKQVNVAE